MLPNDRAAREEYAEMREFRERCRCSIFKMYGGDIDLYLSYLSDVLISDSCVATFRENIDYLEESGYLLTGEMRDAATNLVSWGEKLAEIIREKK